MSSGCAPMAIAAFFAIGSKRHCLVDFVKTFSMEFPGALIAGVMPVLRLTYQGDDTCSSHEAFESILQLGRLGGCLREFGVGTDCPRGRGFQCAGIFQNADVPAWVHH